jgi:hypothetical protein
MNSTSCPKTSTGRHVWARRRDGRQCAFCAQVEHGDEHGVFPEDDEVVVTMVFTTCEDDGQQVMAARRFRLEFDRDLGEWD